MGTRTRTIKYVFVKSSWQSDCQLDFTKTYLIVYWHESDVSLVPQVLGECTVERIVAKRFREKKAFFLVRWKGYDPEEDTWEPKQHLPDDILCKFENPEPHIVRVDDARERLALVIEKGMRRCLRTSEIIDVRHDAVRGLFPQYAQSTWSDLFCYWKWLNWRRTSTTSGAVRGILHHKKCKLVFPVQLQLRLDRPPQFFNSDGTKKKRRAVKRLKITSNADWHPYWQTFITYLTTFLSRL